MGITAIGQEGAVVRFRGVPPGGGWYRGPQAGCGFQGSAVPNSGSVLAYGSDVV